ncbi:hypothetical protein IM697_41455 [Streptomyces ferrugineus]|uniref:Uncharacterized protein n=1 Tax=Streptomyces ferrugineus TaxID=1413221 RepID=A0A7M2SK80_9ACTN|nr:hypothetical protein [Streptomyces ferrugineus]QOV36399.1 hypothetical protein IM697_41455 [Streptomyces ferrugineus]
MALREWAWRIAELRQRGVGLAAFVAACGEDEARALEARRLAALVYVTGDVDEAEGIVLTLEEWADDLAGHPHHPGVPRPDEADRLTRDHLKDVLRAHLTPPARNWMSGTRLSLDVSFHALRRARGLDPRIREDAYYAYGRGTMALDLGHRAAAQREVERLRELRDAHV